MKKINYFLLAIIAVVAISCAKNHEPLLVKEKLYFTDITKIFEKNGCNGCHNAITKSYKEVLKKWVDTTIVPENTVLYTAIKDGGPMNSYFSSKLDIENILEWITNNAPEGEPIIDTTPAPVTPTDKSYYTTTIYPILKNTCMGCHHSETEIIYDNLFKTNGQGAIWIENQSDMLNSLVYTKLSTGSMKDYIQDPDRTTVLNWLTKKAYFDSYDLNIKPTFIKHCLSCHDFVGTYSTVMTNWVDMNVSPESTLLYTKIKSGGSMYENMPSDSVNVVLEWIKDGANQ